LARIGWRLGLNSCVNVIDIKFKSVEPIKLVGFE
jgi:hypothetical protein